MPPALVAGDSRCIYENTRSEVFALVAKRWLPPGAGCRWHWLQGCAGCLSAGCLRALVADGAGCNGALVAEALVALGRWLPLALVAMPALVAIALVALGRWLHRRWLPNLCADDLSEAHRLPVHTSIAEEGRVTSRVSLILQMRSEGGN